MALFESAWDTKSSNDALVRNTAPGAKPKSDKKNKGGRDSTSKAAGTVDADGGANIDLDKLLKKMTDIGGGEVKGKGKDKGKGKGGEKEGGRQAKSKDKGPKPGKESMGSSKPGASAKEDVGVKKDKKKERGKDEGGPVVTETEAGVKRKAEDEEDGSKTKSKKQKKNRKEPKAVELKTTEIAPEETTIPDAEEDSPGPMSELQKLMKKNLQGSKFRILNEKLYKSSSHDAQAMMRTEPETHQTKSWPSNPVDLISTSLSTLPPRSIIVDLGCGDAQLAKTLVPQGLNVLSFDLVSDNKWVVEADICTRIPLPGSEEAQNEGAVADACVCSLSLMSTNWIGCAREAWRVLRIGGRFVVAEVTSRFRDSKEFCKVLSDLGFELIEQSAPSTHFLLFEFRKVERKQDVQASWKDIQSRAEGLLKPCEYKRR